MNEIPIIESDAVPENTIYLVPRITAHVYVPAGRIMGTVEQWWAEQDAMFEAYRKAAHEGRIGVITNIGEAE